MARYFLTRLRIEGFRGINNENHPLDLKFKRSAVNSVFAPNGFGKSSIYDALSFAIFGRVKRLDNLQAADQASVYYHNHFHSGACATIALTLEPDDGGRPIEVVVRRDAQHEREITSPSGHPDPEGLLNNLRADFVLLDYATFQAFINDTALDRGRTFSGLLGLSQLSEFRQAMQMLAETRAINTDFKIETLEQQQRLAKEACQRAAQRISEGVQLVLGTPPADPFDAVAVSSSLMTALRRAPLIASFFSGPDFASVDFASARRAIHDAEGGAAKDRLSEVLRDIADLEALSPGVAEGDEQQALRKLIEDRERAASETRGLLFRDMYKSVERVLQSGLWTDLDRCPACEAVPDIVPATHIAAQLSRFEALRSIEDQHAMHAQASWLTRLKKLEDSKLLAAGDEAPIADQVIAAVTAATITSAELAAAIERLRVLERRRADTVNALQSERTRIEQTLPPSLVRLTQQVEVASQVQSALCDLAKHQEMERSAASKLKRRAAWKQFISSASRKFAEAEAELSKNKIAAVEAEYRSLFSQIMVGQEVVPKLQRPARSQDLHLRLEKFYGLTDLAARPLLSESYRNAFAMALFLSAALRSKGAARFMVLDDVTSSFDAGHQWNLMEVLRTRVSVSANPDGLQCIILSHDGLLERYFDRRSNGTDWHHHRLEGRPPNGVLLARAQESERLRALAVAELNNGKVRQAEPLIRQYLEYKLLQIISKVGIPVPFDFAMRDHNRTVQNCLDAINAAVSLHKMAGTLIMERAKLVKMQNVLVPALVGNWVAHYETGLISSLSPSVLLGVLDTVDDFANCFQYQCSCKGNKNYRYFKSLQAKHCSC